jgi:Bacteriocin-protection, YdeI or OmpD-Associated
VKIQIREENGLSTKPRCHSKLMSDALSEKEISGGVVHDLPEDLKKALTSDAKALETWEDITPLARNEWICWIESAKKAETRTRRIEWGCSSLKEGKRRPCCWPGCPHR